MKTIGQILKDRDIVGLREDASVLDAARSMAEHHVGAIMVTDMDGGPVGIFTERDLMLRVVVAGLDPSVERLHTHMTRKLYTADPGMPVNKVAQELQTRHIRHLPVVADERVVGMLSLRDLLAARLESTTKEVTALTEYIQGSPTEEPKSAAS